MLSLHSYVLPLHSYMRSFPPAAFHSLLPFTPRLGAKGQPKRAGGEIKPLQKRASPPAPLWFSLCTPFPHPPPPLPVFVWRLCLFSSLYEKSCNFRCSFSDISQSALPTLPSGRVSWQKASIYEAVGGVDDPAARWLPFLIPTPFARFCLGLCLI
jgi:hypothetical protein